MVTVNGGGGGIFLRGYSQWEGLHFSWGGFLTPWALDMLGSQGTLGFEMQRAKWNKHFVPC